MQDRKHRIAILFFVLAMAIRLGYLAHLHRDPAADVLQLDAFAYDNLARQIADGTGFPDKVFFQAPLYPFLLGWTYRLFGRNLDLIRILQMLLDSLAVALLFLTTDRILSRAAACIAGTVLSVYPVMIFQSGLILKTSLNIFLSALLLFLILGMKWEKGHLRYLIIGIVVGLATMAQGSVMLQIPVILLWVVARDTVTAPQKWIVHCGMILIGFLGALSPVTLHNYRVGGEFVLLTTQGGANLYIGNSPYSNGTSGRPPRIRMTPEFEEMDFHREAERACGKKLTAHEASKYWFRQSIKWMKEHPVQALKLQIRKFGLFWNRVEIPDNYDFDFYRRYSRILRSFRYPFLVVGIAGVLGMIFLLPRIKDLWFLYLWFWSFCFIVTGFHVYSRYRLPAVLYLAPFAGQAPLSLLDFIRQRQWKKFALSVLGVVLLFSLMSLKLTHYSHAQSYFNLGSALARLGKPEAARKAYMDALEISGDHVPALINLGKLFFQAHQMDQAKIYWNRALALNPESAELQNNLGTLAVMEHRLDSAENHFKNATRIQPDYFLAWLQLGQIYQMKKNFPAAVQAFGTALELEPENAQALYGLAVSSESADPKNAIKNWKRYMEIAENKASEQKFLAFARARINALSQKD